MSGLKQHYVPQFVMSGFATAGKGKYEQVRVHRRDKNFLSSTEGIGAQRAFYSQLDENAVTLDDVITDAETHDYSQIHRSLLQATSGKRVSALEASRLVAHLAIRGNHIRDSLAVGTRYAHQSVVAALSDTEICRKIMGFSAPEPNERIKAAFDRLFNEKKAQIQKAGMSRHNFRLFAFKFAKARWDDAFVGLLPTIASTFEGLDYFSVVADEHKKALEKDLESEPRVTALTDLNWRVVEVQDALILPDCVAIADDAKDGPMPLAYCSADNLRGVVFPLSPNKALCGGTYHLEKVFDALLPRFHSIAAHNSWEFFIANPNSYVEDSTQLLIGGRLYDKFASIMNEVITEALIEGMGGGQ
jgi:hypothetical protein